MSKVQQKQGKAQTKATQTQATHTNSVVERLWETMPSKERIIAQTKEGAVYGEYIELSQVLRRLQDVFGLNYEIYLSEPIVYYEDEKPTVVAISAVVSITRGEEITTVQGYGTAPVFRGLEFAIKAAETDAIKRACRLLGIGMFLYEREVRFSRNGSSPKQAGKQNTAPAKGRNNKNGNSGKGNTVREQIMSDKALADVIRYVAYNQIGERMTLDEIAEHLTERVSEKQAWLLMRYPDILEEALQIDEEEENSKELFADLVGQSIRRLNAKESWRDNYYLDEDDIAEFLAEEEEAEEPTEEEVVDFDDLIVEEA